MTPDPWLEPELTELPDGTRVVLRPIRPDDAPRLQTFHARLSPQSVYLRWLNAHPVLTDDEAASLSQLDYHDRMAYVAILSEVSPEAIMGVARYAASLREGPGVAEAAVVVADACQQRGLGTLLLRRLLGYARTQGLTTWVADINAENARMLRFLQRGGLPTTKRLDTGSWQVRINISGETEPPAS